MSLFLIGRALLSLKPLQQKKSDKVIVASLSFVSYRFSLCSGNPLPECAPKLNYT